MTNSSATVDVGRLPTKLALAFYGGRGKPRNENQQNCRPASAHHSLSNSPKKRTQIKKSNSVLWEIWISDPGIGPIGFVSKVRRIWLYLFVWNSDMDPDRTEIDFGQLFPQPV